MIDRMLFFDIETAPIVEKLSDLDEAMAGLWRRKVDRDGVMTMAELDKSWERAGIYAEFGKIVCISIGATAPSGTVRLKSFRGEEATLLAEFSTMLNDNYKPSVNKIAGHNISKFDIPFVIRRMIILGMDIPKMIDIRGKKPWELKFVFDTMTEWAMGDYRNNVSLDLLCKLFGVPTPKTDMDGSKVGEYFYAGRIDEIVTYCEKDVEANITVGKIILK